MFVALRSLKVDGRTVAPGEPVPEAAAWQESVRRAHLNLGWIKEDQELPATPKARPVVAAPKEGAVPANKKVSRRTKTLVS